MSYKFTSEHLENDLYDSFQNIPEQNQAVAKQLIHEIIFMREVLDDLHKEVKEKGTIVEFKQGSQELERENPALKSYNTLIGKYNQYMKQLLSLYPEQQIIDSDVEALRDWFADAYE